MVNSIKHIVVLVGGTSVEREISLLSGELVIPIIQELGYQVTVIDPDHNLSLKLMDAKPDLVFNLLHGGYGENGAIAGLLEVMKIPYTHSGIMSSALGMNKQMVRELVASRGMKIAPGKVITLDEMRESLKNKQDLFPKPYVIKPLQEGSSLGVHIVQEGDLLNLEPDDWKYGDKILVEQYIPGKELSVAYLGDRALDVLELRSQEEFLNYKAKYTDGGSEHILPAEVPDMVYRKALKYAEVAHELLGCRTLSRSDFRYNDDEGIDGLYFLEINTHPGLTKYSMVPDIIKHAGLTMKNLVERLIQDAKYDTH